MDEQRLTPSLTTNAGGSPGVFALWAERYLEAGIRSVPLNGKAPCVSAWQVARDPETIRGWATDPRYSASGIGAPTGEMNGILVVDIDRRELEAQMLDRCGPTPLLADTSRGVHCYYRFAGERSAAKLDGLPVDVLASGKQVVLPPTQRPDGFRYSFRGEPENLRAAFESLPPVRPGSLPLVGDSPATTPTERRGGASPGGVPPAWVQPEDVDEGARSDHLLKRCCAFVMEARSVAEIEAYAAAEARRYPGEPLEPSKIRSAARSAWRYRVTGTLRTAAARSDWDVRTRAIAAAGGADAYMMFDVLRRVWGARGETFALSPRSMAKGAGRHADILREADMGEHRIRSARNALVRLGLLVRVREGGGHVGDAALFRLAEGWAPSPPAHCETSSHNKDSTATGGGSGGLAGAASRSRGERRKTRRDWARSGVVPDGRSS